jgi:signal transduction histidine kinase
MTEPMPLSRMDPAERRMLPAVTVVPYVLLVILALTAPAVCHGRALLVVLVLCAVDAAWMLSMFTLHPAWRVRPRPMAVFFIVQVLIMFVLVTKDPFFGFFTAAGYLYAATVLRWPWQLAGVLANAVVAGTAQSTGLNRDTLLGMVIYAAIIAVNAVFLGGSFWLARKQDLARDAREEALAEASETNRRLEATLAENAGLHEQLVTQAREAGILDERQRMAREIHDTLAQGLTGIITQLQAAEQAADDPAGWRRHFTAAQQLARDSLSEARRSVDALRPEPLETGRLSDALASVAGRWSALHQIPARVATTGTARPMPPEAEFALLRAAQEALANVAKHARAARVGVTLSYLENEVALDVRDDGTGFDPDRLAGPAPVTNGSDGGFGLVAMRQRIEDLAGTLQVESEPGGGTAISARIPAASAGAGQ